MQLITSLETEKRICMERVKRAEKKVERFEKEAQAKSSRTNVLLVISHISCPHSSVYVREQFQFEICSRLI